MNTTNTGLTWGKKKDTTATSKEKSGLATEDKRVERVKLVLINHATFNLRML